MGANFHKNFKLNNTSFSSETALLLYAESLDKETALFLKEWFSKADCITVQTSGSTGTPKLIQLQKKHVLNSALATGCFFNLKENTTALLCLPVGYIAGKLMWIRALTLGWHLEVIPSSSSPLKDNKNTYDFCAMVPLQLENSLEKISQIKKIIVGGGVVSSQLQQKLQGSTTQVFATYGMTETITHIAVKRLNNFHFLNGEGDAKSRVKNNENAFKTSFYQTLPDVRIYKDERNCLVIKANKVAAAVIFTNDVVQLLSDTQFKWLGRFDNVINSGGIKLHPEIIEAKLATIITHQFFVAGIFDEKLGEKLVVIIALESWKIETYKIELQTKINALKVLSKFEKPKEIYFLDAFVITETKKIQRKKTLDLLGLTL